MIRLGELESKWAQKWELAGAFHADRDPNRPKVFVTFPYPYMNGPLHLGHAFTSLRVDVYARYKRMKGFNVLFPWAWHWTGQPIVSAADRLAKGDPIMIKEFKETDHIPEAELVKFTDPVYMARYYTEHNREAVKLLGLSVDWRREFHTSTYEPAFSRFVEWQYLRLRDRGFVVQGTHPVVWCPNDQSPTGDHDRLEGEGVAPEEYTLVKFKLEGNDRYLVAATFRPETIFGATNLWVNPDGYYSEVVVDGEDWIVSDEASKKLVEQGRRVATLRRLDGLSLLEEKCVVPLVDRVVPVLPALFVDTDSATGIVYSVPAHAPYDWLALRDLKAGHEKLRQYKVRPELVEGTRPISIIELPGYGAYPAIEAVDALKVVDQLDPKGETATKEVYVKEFHQGRMKDNCLAYSGMKVSDAKAAVIRDLTKAKLADKMYELPQEVVCRCMTRCIVKVLEDQWFLRYSDESWKKTSLECVYGAKVYPEEARRWFVESINWIREWPCARKIGLGTPLPWDKDWIVETLSDSTVYMAFYTIAHLIRENAIPSDSLKPEVFDYVYFGKGDKGELSRATGIPPDLLDRMREEFLYWYPVDLRNSAKELVPNHLTFFIMQHVALFERRHWPRGIGVNGMMQLEGTKMSKSKGNVIPIKDALERFGSDAVRATLLASAEGMDDPDWRTKNAEDLRDRINSLTSFIEKLLSSSTDRQELAIDRWLTSVLQKHIKATGEAIEGLNTRTAFQVAFFDAWNDLKWYLRRASPRRETVQGYVKRWLLLLAPFIPFTVEELNEKYGAPGFASLAKWPEHDPKLVDEDALLGERLVERTVQDIREISVVLKSPASRAHIYVADEARARVFRKVASALKEGRTDGDVIREMVESAGPSGRASAAALAQAMLRHCRSLGGEWMERALRSTDFDELRTLWQASEFIASETGLKEVHVEVHSSDSISKKKQLNPLPLKPAIVLE